jgi:hypothetical protein
MIGARDLNPVESCAGVRTPPLPYGIRSVDPVTFQHREAAALPRLPACG